MVFPAIKRFAERLKQRCDLEFQWSKTLAYGEELRELPDYAMPGIRLAGEEVEGEFLEGLMVYGAPVGSRAYIDHKLREVARAIVEDSRKAEEVLGGDRQALWSTLRQSIIQRFGYLQ